MEVSNNFFFRANGRFPRHITNHITNNCTQEVFNIFKNNTNKGTHVITSYVQIFNFILHRNVKKKILHQSVQNNIYIKCMENIMRKSYLHYSQV